MKTIKDLQERVLKVGKADFDSLAMDIFRLQAKENPVYKEYLQHLKVEAGKLKHVQEIPFLPIEFFKTKEIRTGEWDSEALFESSGTSYGVRSRHYVQDVDFYHRCAIKAFERLYGPLKSFVILALLPSYLERSHSSLVAMVRHFMERADNPESGFFLHENQELLVRLEKAKKEGKQPLLIGVSFALLELAEKGAVLGETIVMETGGMKGRRKELVRDELHKTLQRGLQVEQIHSEYGMTELLSQAYAKKKGVFETPPWMRVFTRDINDPFSFAAKGRTGGVNVIDLANLHSCAFIETQDLGISHTNGTFEILGRFDNSETRGCNLLLLS